MACTIWACLNGGLSGFPLGFMMIAFFWGIAGRAFFVLAISAILSHVLGSGCKDKRSAVIYYLISTVVLFYGASVVSKSWGFWMSSEWLFRSLFIFSLFVFALMYAFNIVVVFDRRAKS